MAKTKPQKTTRDKSFNYNKNVDEHMISTISSYTATKEFKDIRLMGADDGMTVTGKKIKDHAANNRTLKDLDYNVTVPTTNIDPLKTYDIYGAPFQVVLNNKQHYNNCGVESTLNTLAMAGEIKMKENLSDQKSVEKSFLKKVWNLGLVSDDGVIGKLDTADGGTEPDDYKDILRQFDIESESYFMSTKCDGTQFSDLNELGYKISRGYGAIVCVYADALWQQTAEVEEEAGKEGITHAVAITGVVYANGVDPTEQDNEGKYINTPVGFYIHDSGGWMSRYISIDEFKEVTLYEKHGMLAAEKDDYWNYDDETVYLEDDYSENLRNFDPELREYVGKQPNGIIVTLTTEPVKDGMFDFNATGDKQDNTIWGNSGNNVIKGMNGEDVLYGNAGNDEIRGGKGNDIIIGNNLSAQVKDELNEKFAFAIPDKIGTSKTYQEGMNKIYGDAGNDIIIGGDDIDLIYGGAGNDKIYAGDGRNAVYGGKGSDFLLGGWENDRLFGDAGNDTIYGWGDDDTIHGGSGNDTIYGGSGNDRIETGKGNDTIYFEGTEHGIDVVSSEGGTTIFKFADETYIDEDGKSQVWSEGATVSDMYFSLGKNEENANKYDFGIAYTPDEDDAKDGISFDSYYNYKKNTGKTLTIVDAGGETYKVSASKSAKVKASTGNNVMFSLRDMGAEITTSTNNDIVTMVETEDMYNRYSDSETVYDSITYTGGNDRYVSEERNTYYYVENFSSTTGSVTNLSIYDNVDALEKVVVGPDGKPVKNPDGSDQTEYVVSDDDRLYINTTLSKLGFFFDVIKDDDSEYALGDLYALDKDHVNSDIYINLAKDEDITDCGLISMDTFFGNGEIESLYTKENGTNYTKFQGFNTYIETTTSAVANWLSVAHGGYTYSSAFEAISSDTIQGGDFDSLILCYSLQS